MSSYYSRTGDDGETGLLGEGRVPKNHPKPTAFGAVEEASSALGLARAQSQSGEVQELVKGIQVDLYHLMAELAATDSQAERFRTINQTNVEALESYADSFGARIDLPGEFVLPGDTLSDAAFHLARTIVRRAEREVVNLSKIGGLVNDYIVPFLNRLSSLCFVLALYEVQLAGLDSPSLTKSGEL